MKRRKHHHDHDWHKVRLEQFAAKRLIAVLNRLSRPGHYLLGPHRESPDFSILRRQNGEPSQKIGLEVTHIYGSTHDAAIINGWHKDKTDKLLATQQPALMKDIFLQLDRAIEDKNDKFAAYTIKPCWLLIRNANARVMHRDWQNYLHNKDFQDSPFEKIWLITDRQLQIINIK
ncbi:hypothetical protein [Pseudogulbenkiania subflava]|uniref:Uncharacterized protein n=1 Tax=Pseudogulbenkiania subflava DSM 22618 TaxID=1123014 RepID=A0A1Y6C824_9NEIS|nr:hypothetical protein [Pseudogulbenkiania subflava]SMF41640.1 hypothetical protein SAMN02745746_03102 [Pseudogulbenkiania subflava DSM 22618]